MANTTIDKLAAGNRSMNSGTGYIQEFKDVPSIVPTWNCFDEVTPVHCRITWPTSKEKPAQKLGSFVAQNQKTRVVSPLHPGGKKTRIMIGEVIYESVNDAARALERSPQSIFNWLREGVCPDGKKAERIEEIQEKKILTENAANFGGLI